MTIRDRELAAIITAWHGGNTATKKEAGRAIARVLREGPLSVSSRRMLADLFDPPDMGKPDFANGTFQCWYKTGRKQKIKDGRPRKADPIQLAAAVDRYIKDGNSKKRAYWYAAKELRVSYRTAEKAYAEHAKPLLQHVSRLNTRGRTIDIGFLYDENWLGRRNRASMALGPARTRRSGRRR
jgi:hypothetical protein